ncbi:hypothetical protein RO179_000742 [Escherichia coli]|uniref:DUF7370 family protein n=1 Tax=Escherichia coli TaxID=562 RepID=UPI001807CF4D|nr:hypothetical protein [Escherichia coli]EER4310908.1 hypothetical protein [Escherichia coli]EFE2459134.1 hypothetical protein [Escherichia coli]EFS9388041.1 hypothetical protein [Escherichia coli]EIF1221206.1 hypothetical protein [Escherichia coli]ELH9086299.1 hypothetical protein [Escherichia coli]
MVTTEQARDYLDSQGIELPDIILDLMVEQANSVNECLDANYPASTATLIQLYLIGLLGLTQANKYISSQTGPNGASQSYRYVDFNKKLKAARTLLYSVDKHHCTAELIPADPEATAHAGIWIGKSGRL